MGFSRGRGTARAQPVDLSDEEPEEPQAQKKCALDVKSFASELRGQRLAELEEYDPDWDLLIRQKKQSSPTVATRGEDEFCNVQSPTKSPSKQPRANKRLGSLNFSGSPTSAAYTGSERGTSVSTMPPIQEPHTPTLWGGRESTTPDSPLPTGTLEVSYNPEKRLGDVEDRVRDGDESWQQTRMERQAGLTYKERESTSNYIEDNEDESLQQRGQRNNEELLGHLRSHESEEESEVGESQTLQVVLPHPPDISTGQGRYDLHTENTEGHDLDSPSWLKSPNLQLRSSLEDNDPVTLDYYEGDLNDFCELEAGSP
uniref:Uncharacterized protein n=1 Tax=Pyramimonas obovata TaxID=1411642 RepID=A0A7S0RV44_9CHLO|mmetsp:Transcript_7190/g.14610  ORF Transcript_7190/g.14610 Transcript_7190/m.14610 type:complete len:314 (+) Transcript_7190:241-1182(+)|eukprot:CAMPEP_0118925118 /NCGR_PEP_ID=MMETSP1169-20130426/3035_1 /TAXON_ID=36882 /ORGANISM="Pyramimonas obovata, Strain CCMP722" /LENGTH=313 /DNA_ID=CAMNT_0006866325 /DNA_START=190 /DNA_END=1131 /DNA_ORIENTATION=+